MKAKFFIGLIARVVPLTLAFLFAISDLSVTIKGAGYVTGIVLLIIAEYLASYRPLTQLEAIREKLLEQLSKSLFSESQYNGKKVEVRANVMIIGHFWVWKHFFPYFQHNMKGARDANFHFSINKGFCGKKLKEGLQKAHFIETQGSNSDYGWNRKEKDTVVDVKAIITVPLEKQIKKFSGRSERVYFGCLNVDTLEDDGAKVLAEPLFQQKVLNLALLTQILYEN